jgi:drug/metabolite transporter (DMT)-like permease
MPVLAFILALSSILLWSFLAFLGTLLKHLDPFLITGVALCIGSSISLLRWRQWRVPLRVFLVGVGGLFGYHFLYFAAFQRAPAVETNLINYLWPLLIVLLAPSFLPGYRLGFNHLAGAILGLCGTVLILSGGKISLDRANLPGYLLAAGAALTWAVYSLLTRRLPPFQSSAVGGFCLAGGLLSIVAWSLSVSIKGEGWQMTLSTKDWLLLALVGLGPMGLAFYTWDAALKRGDPRVIASLAYLTPLLSSLVLILFGGQTFTWVSVAAMGCIISGAAVGSSGAWKPQPG